MCQSALLWKARPIYSWERMQIKKWKNSRRHRTQAVTPSPTTNWLQDKFRGNKVKIFPMEWKLSSSISSMAIAEDCTPFSSLVTTVGNIMYISSHWLIEIYLNNYLSQDFQGLFQPFLENGERKFMEMVFNNQIKNPKINEEITHQK